MQANRLQIMASVAVRSLVHGKILPPGDHEIATGTSAKRACLREAPPGRKISGFQK
jgi:hypothetical protein